eukprot:320832_1
MTAFMPSRPGKYHNSPLRNNSTAIMPQRIQGTAPRPQGFQGRAPGMFPGMSSSRAARPNPRRLNSRQDFIGWVMQFLTDPLNCVFTIMLIGIGCVFFNKIFKEKPNGTASTNGTGFFSNTPAVSSSVIDYGTLEVVVDRNNPTIQQKTLDGKLVYWDPKTQTEVYLPAKTEEVDWKWKVFGCVTGTAILAEMGGYLFGCDAMRLSSWMGKNTSHTEADEKLKKMKTGLPNDHDKRQHIQGLNNLLTKLNQQMVTIKKTKEEAEAKKNQTWTAWTDANNGTFLDIGDEAVLDIGDEAKVVEAVNKLQQEIDKINLELNDPKWKV